MKRFLVALALFTVVMLVLRRLSGLLSRAGSAGRPAGGRVPRAARQAGELVRDRVCDTYILRDRALQLEDASGVHFFCSEGCRARHAGGSHGIGAA